MGNLRQTCLTCLQALLALLVFQEVCSSKYDPGMYSSDTETKDVIVHFGSYDEMSAMAYQLSNEYSHLPYDNYNKAERIYKLYEAMDGYSKKCKADAHSYLDSESYNYRNYWASNSMLIYKADKKCVDRLSTMEDVTRITEDRQVPLYNPAIVKVEHYEDNTAPAPFTLGKTYGFSIIRAWEAWNFASEYEQDDYEYGHKLKQGSGIVVGSIDTGVNVDHVRLRDNFRKYAAWADGYNVSRDVPVDLSGHGTHTMGTIVGAGGVGVAPAAKWVACRGCGLDKTGNCLESALIACCQWMLCPHDGDYPDHGYKECIYAPDIVSNSWGGDGGDETFRRCASNLKAAGIFPVWAIGNSGPECGTAGSPGDLEDVISVGATDEEDKLTWFSSRGPPKKGYYTKPEISAPGMSVKSCWFNTTTSLVTISGTSMSTPHVSGVIALMLERCRLDYYTIRNLLLSSADRDMLGNTTQVCGGTTSKMWPNNFYGYGRVNALEAVKRTTKACYLNKKEYPAKTPYEHITSDDGDSSSLGRSYSSGPHGFYNAPAMSPNYGFPPGMNPTYGYPMAMTPIYGYPSDMTPNHGYPPPMTSNYGFPSGMNSNYGYSPDMTPNFGYAPHMTPNYGFPPYPFQKMYAYFPPPPKYPSYADH